MGTLEEKIKLIDFKQEDEKLMDVIKRALDGYAITQSLITRMLPIGYSRAGRLLDRLVELEILEAEEVRVELKFDTDEVLFETTKTQYKINNV